MSALDRVRKKFGNLESGTDKTDKRPSVGSVSSSPGEIEKFGTPSVSSVGTEFKEVEKFSADLERRIRLMARRWQYTDDELAEVLALARENPAGWLRAVALDERREDEFRRAGLLPRADA